MTPVASNLRWGIRWALWVATGLSAWTVLLSLLRHSWRFRFDDLEITTAGIIAGYYAAALIAGTATGLLRPLTQWRIGTFMLGVITGTLVYATIGFTMYGWNEALLVAPVLGLATGGLALVFQDEDAGYAAPKPRRVVLLGAVAILLLIVLWFMYWR